MITKLKLAQMVALIDTIKAADSVEIHFQFAIEEVYAGTKYDDTCLTGLVIDFMGLRGH